MTLDLVGEAFTHPQPRLVNRYPVDHRVRPREIHELEDARIERGILRALATVEIAVQVDENRLARRHVAHQLEAERVERDAFRRDLVIVTAIGLGPAEHQRPDTVGVAEREQSVAGNHRHHRIGPAAAPVHAGNRAEDRRRIELVIGRPLLQLVRENVQQHFGIRVRVDVAQILAEKIVLQLLGIGEIAIVSEHDAEGGVHVERLRFRRRPGRAGRGITRVGDAGVTHQRTHVAGAEHVAHHAAALVHVEGRALGGDDARGILPAMLQHQQTVIEQLVYRVLRHHTKNSAHRVSSVVSDALRQVVRQPRPDEYREGFQRRGEHGILPHGLPRQ